MLVFSPVRVVEEKIQWRMLEVANMHLIPCSWRLSPSITGLPKGLTARLKLEHAVPLISCHITNVGTLSVVYEFFKKTWRIGFYFCVFKNISLKILWSMSSPTPVPALLGPVEGDIWLKMWMVTVAHWNSLHTELYRWHRESSVWIKLGCSEMLEVFFKCPLRQLLTYPIFLLSNSGLSIELQSTF